MNFPELHEVCEPTPWKTSLFSFSITRKRTLLWCYPKGFSHPSSQRIPNLPSQSWHVLMELRIQIFGWFYTRIIPNIPAARFCFHERPNFMFSPDKSQVFKEIKLLNNEKLGGKKCHFSSVSISFLGGTWAKGILITQTITFQRFPPKIAIFTSSTTKF